MVRAGTAEVKDLSEGRNSTGYPYWPAGNGEKIRWSDTVPSQGP